MRQRHASGLIDLLRKDLELRAENAVLIRIPEARELTGNSSGDWRALLEIARTTQACLSIAERYDHLIGRVTQASTRAEIDHLLEPVELHERWT